MSAPSRYVLPCIPELTPENVRVLEAEVARIAKAEGLTDVSPIFCEEVRHPTSPTSWSAFFIATKRDVSAPKVDPLVAIGTDDGFVLIDLRLVPVIRDRKGSVVLYLSGSTYTVHGGAADVVQAWKALHGGAS